MNRNQQAALALALSTPSSTQSSESSPLVEHSILSHGDANGLKHASFAPLHYERNYAYPLLVWLHGPGDDERQLQRVMPLISMRNYSGIAPRGNRAHADGRGFYWEQTSGSISKADQNVIDCIEIAKERFHIAPDRIFVGGYDCGGTMAMRIGLNHPDLFAGAISIGGPFPTGHSPLRQLDLARQLPLFIAQGQNAKKYTQERTCEELRLFHAAGMSATLRQYPCEDELTTQMLLDLNTWMMEQVTGSAKTEPSESV